MVREFAITAALVELVFLSACGTSVDRPATRDNDQTDAASSIPRSPTPHRLEPPEISLRDVEGLEELREVARRVQAQHSYSALALSLSVSAEGSVIECRIVENPGQGTSGEVLTADERSSLCTATRELRFPTSGEPFEYRLNIGPPHLR